MKKSELKKGMKVWCWWKSRFLYFEGTVKNAYKFVDICDAITIIPEKQLKELIVK